MAGVLFPMLVESRIAFLGIPEMLRAVADSDLTGSEGCSDEREFGPKSREVWLRLAPPGRPLFQGSSSREEVVDHQKGERRDEAGNRDGQDPSPEDVLCHAPAHGAEPLNATHAHDAAGDRVRG